MKSIQFLIMASVFLFGLSGCSSNSPKITAQKFLNAFNEKNYEEARKYSTPETIKLIDLMENLSKMATDPDTIQQRKIEVIDEKIDGDTAMVTFREEGSDETDELKLIMVDGKWLVHITKTDMTMKGNSVFNTEEEGVMMEPDTTSILESDSSAEMQSE